MSNDQVVTMLLSKIQGLKLKCSDQIYVIMWSFIDNAEDLDIVMPMYNLLEYSDN